MSTILLRRTSRSLCSICSQLRHVCLYGSSTSAQPAPSIGDHDSRIRNSLPGGPGSTQVSEGLIHPLLQESGARDGNITTANGDENDTQTEDLNEGIQQSNPLQPNKVDLYLASIRAAGIEPTLEDIDRCRPARHAHPDSPEYARDYNTLVDTLCRSFSKQQLRGFGELYGLNSLWTRKSRRKVEYAESIIEKQWGWPSLKELERQRRDRTEVSMKTFNVNPSQLFLILGKDGADLLQLSLEFDVHISVTAEPLTLRVEGLRGAIKAITERIAYLKKGIMEEIVQLPTKSPIPQDMVQKVSRLSGAFIENLGYRGKVRICAKDSHKLLSAKRLVIHTACEVRDPLQPLVVSHVSSTPYKYALYPFLPFGSLPWSMGAGNSFRIRRVGDWLGFDTTENTPEGTRFKEGPVNVISSKEDFELDKLLLGKFQQSEHIQGTVTAITGHRLIAPAITTQRATLIPPFPGSHSVPEMLRWLDSADCKSVFVASQPSLFLERTLTYPRMSHRLTYRVLSLPLNDEDNSETHLPSTSSPNSSIEVIKLEVIPSTPGTVPSPDTSARLDGPRDPVDGKFCRSNSARVADVEDEHRSTQDNGDDDVDSLPDDMGQPAQLAEGTLHSIELSSRFRKGTESIVDVMLPNRPMDIRFSVFASTELSNSDQPSELRTYMSALQEFFRQGKPASTPPFPPLTFAYNAQTYILHENTSVRQDVDKLLTVESEHPESIRHSGQDSPAVDVLVEKILDLESHDISSACQIVCHDPINEDNWKEFLGQCDRLTKAAEKRFGIGVSLNHVLEGTD